MNDVSSDKLRRLGTSVGLALFLSALAFALREAIKAPPWTIDDAFITARYADHLAHSGVFAYNLDGPRVEGITSPLFALIGAAASRFGVPPVVAMTTAGIAAYVASGPLVFALARELRLPLAAAGAFVWLYLAIPEHVTHATSGLETEAFVAAQLACVLALTRWWRAPKKQHLRALASASLLACLLRPEGAVVAALSCGVAALRVRYRTPDLRAVRRTVMLGLGLPLLIGLLARVAYFHAVLPNTFFAKRRGALSGEHLIDTAKLVEDYLLDVLVVGAAFYVIARLLGVRRGRFGKRGPMLVALSLSMLAVFASAYAHKDVMNYSRRFAIHGLPWLVTITLVLVSFVAARLVRLRAQRGRLVFLGALALGLAFGTVVWVPRWSLRRDVELERMADHLRIRHDWYEPARAILVAQARMLGHPPKLAVYPDAGYLPYRTDYPTVDFGRLNDRHLAREVRTSQEVVDYFFESAPDAVVFSHYGPDRMWNEEAKSVMRDPRFERYKPVKEWRDARQHGISLYVRR